MAGPGHAPQSTNDDRDEGDQIACARHRRGRGQDRRYRRSRRSSSISAGRWSREVPPPRSGGSSYVRRPPPLDVERLPAPRPRGPARPIRRHSPPAERSASRAPDGSWIFRRTDGRRSPDYQRASSEGRGRTRSGSCADDAPRRGRGRPDACLRGRTNGGPCSRSRRGGQKRASRLDGKVPEVHDDWGFVFGIGGIGHPHWSGCHVGVAR